MMIKIVKVNKGIRKIFIVVILLANSSLFAQIPTNGLAGFYPFNGNVNDESGFGNNGINNNAELARDRNEIPGSAFYFNGLNNYISLPVNYDFVPRTINLWFYAVDFDYSDWKWIYISDNPKLKNGLASLKVMEINNGLKLFMTISGCEDTFDIKTNVWYNASLIVNNDNSVMFYLNCEFMGRKTFSSFITSIEGSENVIIGAGRFAGERYFKGFIDDILIYDRVLSSEEIRSIYYAGDCDHIFSVTPQIFGPVKVCASQNAVEYSLINMSPNSILSWSYSGAGTTINGTGSDISLDFASNSSSGTLQVIGDNISSNIRDTAILQIVVNPKPVANPVGNSPVCIGGSINLFSVGNDGNSFFWSGPMGFSSTDQNPVINAATQFNTGNYILVVSNSDCFSEPSNLTVSVQNCIADDLGILKIVNYSRPNIGQIIEFTILASNNGPNEINSVLVADLIRSGYTYISSTASVGNFNTSSGDWIIGTLGSGESQVLTIMVSVNPTGDYENSATIVGNLIEANTDNNKAVVNTIPNRALNDLNIPNSFSPNGDGINDLYVIRGSTEKSKLLIFDRFGAKVYESDDYQNDWNGIDLKGNRLDSDTYWYVLSIAGIPTEFKGFIYLKR